MPEKKETCGKGNGDEVTQEKNVNEQQAEAEAPDGGEKKCGMRYIGETVAEMFGLVAKVKLLEVILGALSEEDEGEPTANVGLHNLITEIVGSLVQLNQDLGPISGVIERMQMGREVQLPDSELIFRPVEADQQPEA